MKEVFDYFGVDALPNDWLPEGLNQSLETLEAKAKLCQSCGLSESRNKVVFGCGNIDQPLICFVGEGPGVDEDRLGEPFVGRAGVLLDSAIVKGLKLKREDVYFCNAVKCRPPKNRTPSADEIEACFTYLEKQIKLVNPKVIVTLGQVAQKAILGLEPGITKLRGSWYEWEGFDVMPTFHPAYILRNPPAKRPFWEDLQSVMQRLNLG